MASRVSSRIPFARFDAALRAGDLGFIRRHRAQLTLSLLDEVDVCALVAAREPPGREAARVAWVSRFAAEANHAQPGDYELIDAAFARLAEDAVAGVGWLKDLCAARGLGR
jgi:hypothetical protein